MALPLTPCRSMGQELEGQTSVKRVGDKEDERDEQACTRGYLWTGNVKGTSRGEENK